MLFRSSCGQLFEDRLLTARETAQRLAAALREPVGQRTAAGERGRSKAQPTQHGADVIVPNLTEAAVLLGEDHSFGALTHDEAGYRSVVERLSRNGTRSVVLTGVMLRKGEIGACVFDRASGGTEFLFDTFIGKEFHGTGDVFASVLTGALVKGKTLHEAVRLAEAFVRECAIQTMPQNIPAREGVDFEPILWKLHEGL